ncbi:MAG TPA: hypothetical protein VKY36_06550 [Moheibacter sp.]|nr:hypothetical protein [Moheibacter sp.]
MWIPNSKEWDSSHTPLSKYFIEKLKQQVDFEETISNQHKSTNGFTLIREIIEVSKLAIKREKSINRLISLVSEAKSNTLKSSIINDYILNQYYPDIISYYKSINENKLKDSSKNVNDLLLKSQIHSKRLENNYFNDIINELKKIDFNSKQFDRNAKVIDGLIDSSIPYLIHKGYSITSLSDISYRFIKKKSGDKAAIRILNKFRNQLSNFEFIIKTTDNGIELKTIKEYLGDKNVDFKIVEDYEQIKDKFTDNIHSNGAIYIKIKRPTTDPHNYLRNLYEISLKRYVVSKSRQDLTPLNDFFERIYWRFDTETHKFEKSDFNLDPLNVKKRKSTLFQTLTVLSKSFQFEFDEESEIPHIEQIADSLYYYNLAIGSKSIENSMSLLWTSLEILLPYRLKDNDISNVQYFVSKMLGVGTIGREVVSFIKRYNDSNWINNKCLDSIGLLTNYINFNGGFNIYYQFLSKTYTEKEDPFNTINNCSPLLAKEFCRLNDIYSGKDSHTVEYLLNKINHSEESIIYQIDRIYLHRNQIVHSGKFINEYSNLWNHLEWYVGKLLSFCVFEYFKLDNKESFDKKELFLNLEAYVDNVKNHLEINRDKKINEIGKIVNDTMVLPWQYL